MRVAVALLMGLHGSIHFLGFAKAFSPGSVSALSTPVSKAMGLLWLATAIPWIAAAIMRYTGDIGLPRIQTYRERWTSSQGPFTYAQFEVTDIAYDVTATSSPVPTS